MSKRYMKKGIAVLITLVLVMGMLPGAVFAGQETKVKVMIDWEGDDAVKNKRPKTILVDLLRGKVSIPNISASEKTVGITTASRSHIMINGLDVDKGVNFGLTAPDVPGYSKSISALKESKNNKNCTEFYYFIVTYKLLKSETPTNPETPPTETPKTPETPKTVLNPRTPKSGV